ncbi:MAG: CPBP family glutamic-type intramembrane protease [Bacteroidota bacterium]|nr:CPBP family glutamic-type intramembrane protease [Bacteroidota bacterium]
MNFKNILKEEESIFKQDDLKPAVILLLAALIPTLHRYFGSAEFYINITDVATVTHHTKSLPANIYFFLSALLLMGVIPLLIIKYFLKERIGDYGLRIGNWKTGLVSIAILFPVIAIAILLPAVYQQELKDFYPFYKGAGESVGSFLEFELWRGLLFYTAWEFFFRGFLLFGLRKFVGDGIAIMVQIIPSCLWHIGYPTGEILMSIPAGMMFGIIALRTNSIIWVWLLHWLIGMGLDVFIILSK